MNNILELKGEFKHRKNANATFGAINLSAKEKVTSEEIGKLIIQLQELYDFWKEKNILGGVLISVHYKRIVPKTARLQYLFSSTAVSTNETIRGARFEKIIDKNGVEKTVHVFTHFVEYSVVEKTLESLQYTKNVLDIYFDGKATRDTTLTINKEKESKKYTRSKVLKCLKDVASVDYFDKDNNTEELKDEALISLYSVSSDMSGLLSRIGIKLTKNNILDDVTFLLNRNQYSLLRKELPYLVSMSVSNMREIANDFTFNEITDPIEIETPKNEPVIGVIDTPFDKEVYFSEWVEYIPMLPDDLAPERKDYNHGTAVTSLIVNAGDINPALDDGCGHFRVRHFGVALGGRFSAIDLMRKIKEIVSNNQDIKVWNLSLGAIEEINKNSISFEGAELDRLQNEYDVIFVVAGTNDKNETRQQRIGAPADSLNSLVVNSVGFNDLPATYTRKGPVLSFFHKPDVAYYGGSGKTQNELIRVCKPLGEDYVAGTSFAAPLIARKLAYLIQIIGLSRELAKALIIDSAASWNPMNSISNETGYGIVPRNIDEIIQSADNEIKFLLSGTIEEYETYTYNLPVPIVDDAFPFYAKATLVYFPVCDRRQGVDYTLTEMDMHFGRVSEKGIKSINMNIQDDPEAFGTYEEDARRLFRKWDNVKHISEEIKKHATPKKVYSSGMWGIDIKTKERVKDKDGLGLNFGLVVTLKEMKNINRIDDFIQRCESRGWIVNPINVVNRIEVYNKANEEIKFE